jgi:DNA-binding MarR family transcriptional regulator
MPTPLSSSQAAHSAVSATEAEILEEASFALFELTLAALAQIPSVPVLQLRALAMIQRHGPLNLSGLAQFLEQSVPSASRLVDRLVEADLTRRETAPHSRREIVIVLSPKGRRTLARLRRGRQAALATILDRMTETERQAIRFGLAAFTRAASSLSTPPGPG